MRIKPKPNNKRTIVPLVGMVFLMGLLSFASVPMYEWFCRVTGYGGTPNTADANNSKVLENTIKV